MAFDAHSFATNPSTHFVQIIVRLKPGDQVTAYVFAAKNGAPVGNLQKIVLPDGKELSAMGAPGSAPSDKPPDKPADKPGVKY